MDKENRREEKNSGDTFSFPSTPNQDSDFEFGSLTPSSPSSDPCRTSPADHLFSNGRLLPHSFPFQHSPTTVYDNYSHFRATTCRTSSIGSKDSLVTSRSNSTSSRSSSCSSARTSSSDSSERKLFYNKFANTSRCQGKSKTASAHRIYGSSRRWQYITPVPALNRDASRRRKGEQNRKEAVKRKKQTKGTFKFGRRILRWLMMTCRECHAMEPCRKDKIFPGHIKL
ncbi:hypothetical protein L6164_022608 [Bauhinia variegata]|uniref:Uncharacterized protein n=1 Tax=Bauhinia variegata TaxID=167791 RepID=A0ACB9MFN1_BAUVA|nr:hypothetical protein L6164_022608 [Bauhinia variegata]